MTTSLTPRLKLLVDTLGETNIDGQSSNWNRVDQAAGILTTTKGVDLPNAQLYDGCIVAESDTGISWRCVDNGAGGFNKQYIKYPFELVAYDTITWSAGTIETGWSSFSTGDAVNSDATMMYFNGPRVPVKGIYNILVRVQFAQNTAGDRAAGIEINSILDNTSLLRTIPYSTGGPTTLNPTLCRVLNANDRITGYVELNGVASLASNYTAVFVQMVRPLP
jgi:hypothetical protein